jgi:hypothetical protein
VGSERPPAMAGGEVVVARVPAQMQVRLGHRARVEAHVWPREELRVTGFPRARAEQRGHRRR